MNSTVAFNVAPCPAAPPAREGSPLVVESEWFRDVDAAEDLCLRYLEELRWPDGVACPRCESHDNSRLVARKRFACRNCKYQFSVSSGTLFHNTHAPLWKWFLAVQLLVDSDGGVPANQLVHRLGGSYKTAWFIEHRVRAAFKPCQDRPRHEVCIDSDAERVYDRDIVGCYHQHGTKHLAAYDAEREWRARNAKNPSCFRETMLVLLQGQPLPYAELIRGGKSGSGSRTFSGADLDQRALKSGIGSRGSRTGSLEIGD